MSDATRIAIATLACTAGLLAPAPASADVYKCAGDGGTPIYQEMPCPKGRELRNFQTDPPQLTVLPAPNAPGATPAPGSAPATPGKDARAVKEAKPAKAATATTPSGAALRKHIRTGMSEAEVLAKIGQPDMMAGNRNRSNARWIYLPAPDDPDTITTMVLTNGKVTDVERKVAKK